MKIIPHIPLAAIVGFFLSTFVANSAELAHHGHVTVNGAPFTGSGSFKFALLNDSGTIVWNHQNGESSAEPTTVLKILATNGFYSVHLGDDSVPDMAALPATLFNDNSALKLRVWFDDGINGSLALTPDQKLSASPYTFAAEIAKSVPTLEAQLVMLQDQLDDVNSTILQALQDANSSLIGLLDNNESRYLGLINDLNTTLTQAIENNATHFENNASLQSLFLNQLEALISTNLADVVANKSASDANATAQNALIAANKSASDANATAQNALIAANKSASDANATAQNLRIQTLEAELSATKARVTYLESSNNLVNTLARPMATLGFKELPNAKLWDLDLTDRNFTSAIWHGVDLNTSATKLIRANFNSASLFDSNFSQADATSAIFVGADLNRSDLSSATFAYADMNGSDMNGTNLADANFTRATFVGADLNASVLTDSIFTDANFTQAILTNAVMDSADFNGTDFNNSKLMNANLSSSWFVDSNFSDANLTSANLSGANLTDANMSRAILYGATIDENTIFIDTNMSGVDLRNVIFSTKADFSNSYLRGANLSDLNLNSFWHNSNTDLGEANMTNVVLSGLALDSYEFNGTIFNGADLSDSNFTVTDLGGAKFSKDTLFSGARFNGSVLRKASFVEANLQGVQFSYSPSNAQTDLEDANMSGADITDANFTGAILWGVDLRSWGSTTVKVSKKTLFYGVEFKNAKLDGLDLGATEANLSGTGPTTPELRSHFGASFKGADLGGVNFSNTNLGTADFAGADLTNANFTGATGNIRMTAATNGAITEANLESIGATGTNVTLPDGVTIVDLN